MSEWTVKKEGEVYNLYRNGEFHQIANNPEMQLQQRIEELEAQNELLTEAVVASEAGFEWYAATYPLLVNECDAEHLALCKRALGTEEQES